MSLKDKIIGIGASIVAGVEDLLGGPLYKIHDYAEWCPLGGNMKFTRCSWTTPQVIRWLKGRGVTHVLNLCAERDDFDVVRDAGMLAWRLPLEDGSPPTPEQVRDVLTLADLVWCAPGSRLAFHCEAGVGRTGCVAALLLVKYFNWTPLAALNDALRHANSDFSVTPAQREFILNLK